MTTTGSTIYLTDILTGEVLTFNQAGAGELDADADVYGNKNYPLFPSRPENWKNSGGRELFTTPGGTQLSKAMSRTTPTMRRTT